MERGSIVKTLAGQLFEIFDRLGGDFSPKLEHHLTGGRLDKCDFVCFHRFFGFGAEAFPSESGNHPGLTSYFTESAETMRMLSIPIRAVGLLLAPSAPGWVAVSPILPSTSSPLITRPKQVYLPSRCGASARQIKN